MDQTARSFEEIINECLRGNGSPGNTSTFRTTARAHANEEYIFLSDLVEDQRRFRRLSVAMTADSVTDSDTPRLLTALPHDFGVLRTAEWRDASTTPDTHHRLDVKTHQEFLTATQGHARAYTLGIPGLVAPRSLTGALQHLMTASASYEVVSDSTADAAGGASPASVTVRGFTDEARTVPRVANADLTGTTAVSLGSFRWIEQVGVNTATTGIVTVRQVTGPVTVAQVMPWARSAGYVALEFDKGLDRDLTLQGRYLLRPPLMVYPGDTPFYLPPAGHGLISMGTLIRCGVYKKLQESRAAIALYETRRAEFLATVQPAGQARARIRLRR